MLRKRDSDLCSWWDPPAYLGPLISIGHGLRNNAEQVRDGVKVTVSSEATGRAHFLNDAQ